MDKNGGRGLTPKRDSDPSSGSRIRAAAPDPRALSLHSPRLLLIVDEPSTGEALRDAVTELGCEVSDVALGLEEALTLVHLRRPDLLVIDLRSDADEASFSRARELAASVALPAVVVQGTSFAPSWKLEPDSHSITPLSRPLSLEALQSAIEGALLRRALKHRELERDWYELTFNALSNALLVTDADQLLRALNRPAELLLGVLRPNALGRDLAELLAPFELEGKRQWEATLRRALAHGELLRLTVSKRRGDGGATSLPCTVAPVVRERVLGLVLAFGDSPLDEQLAATDRLDVLCSLVSSLAHEVNNPLTVTLVNLELALSRVTELGRSGRLVSSEVARLGSFLREARLGAERIDQLVKELRAYARTEEGTTRIVDVNACARWALRFTGPRLEHVAQLTLKLDETPQVRGNELKLSRVILHLLINAVLAVESGPRPAEVRLTTRRDPEGNAVIEVFDTGPPIPEDVGAKLFDPFFSRTPGGPAAGLGLRFCREIVAGLGGALSFESSLGAGTTFRVTLPAAEVEAREPGAVTALERPSQLERGYPALIESSERLAWKLSEVFPKDARLGFSLPHLPDEPEHAPELNSLSALERLKLNQLRAYAHVNALGFFTEVSVAERLRHAAADSSEDPARLRALLRFSEEGLKHQRLFSLYSSAFERDFGSPCHAVRTTSDIAHLLLSHSPVAVVLSSLHFTLASQRYYSECAGRRLEPLMESLLRHQFLEANQHAELDRLELWRAAQGLPQVHIEQAFAEYSSVLETVDDLLAQEAKLALENLACALPRELSPAERIAIVESQHRAHRRVFLLTPLRDSGFRDTVTRLLPSAPGLLDAELAKYATPKNLVSTRS